MRKNRNKLTVVVQGLMVLGCFATASAQASVVNLTFTEAADSFTSTWRIDDNGGGDFSGSDSVIGTYWQVEAVTDASTVLQDTIGHALGPHGDSFEASSYDYGVLPASYFESTSFVLHDNGHRDDYVLTSDFVGGGYDITISGAHTVPVPAAIWLFGSGLGMLGWIRRRKAALISA